MRMTQASEAFLPHSYSREGGNSLGRGQPGNLITPAVSQGGDLYLGMDTKLLSKVIATLLVGVIVGVGLYLNTKKSIGAGRDAFMVQQAERWNRVYSRPPHLMPMIIAGIGLSVIAFGVYEVLANCVCFLLRERRPDDEGSQRPGAAS